MKVTDVVSMVSFDRIEDVSISPRYYGVDDRTSMSRFFSVVSCDWAWIELKLHISYGRSERMHCLHGSGS